MTQCHSASIALVALVSAQPQPPATEVYLAPMPAKAGDVLAAWINISNSPGYDNQPSFLPDGSAILFSSNRDGKQTDIYRYDIATKKRHTADAHARDRVFADGDARSARRFRSIRVEADKTQRLWRFDLDGSNPRLVLENVKPVGYHAWIDDTHLALFILGAGGGAPATLQTRGHEDGNRRGRRDRHRPIDPDSAGDGHGQLHGDRRNAAHAQGVGSEDARRAPPLIAPLEGGQDAAWTAGRRA